MKRKRKKSPKISKIRKLISNNMRVVKKKKIKSTRKVK
jgi:hypothetical protein